MNTNLSLMNPGTSMNFDGQVLQNAQEEECRQEEEQQQNEVSQCTSVIPCMVSLYCIHRNFHRGITFTIFAFILISQKFIPGNI